MLVKSGIINVGSKIKNINSNLAIEKMNGDAYKRITNYNQYYKEKHEREYPLKNIVSYRTENIVRKIWKVTIEYDIPKILDSNSEYNHFDRYYNYFVDATTGEIIGGSAITKK